MKNISLFHTIAVGIMQELMYFSVSTASATVTSFEPRRDRTVPATLAENMTFICTADSSLPLWAVGHSQNLSSQLPLTPIQLQNNILHYKQRGIITEDNTSQHLSRLIVTKVARQKFPLLQVECIALNTTHYNSSGFYYVFTNGKSNMQHSVPVVKHHLSHDSLITDI